MFTGTNMCSVHATESVSQFWVRGRGQIHRAGGGRTTRELVLFPEV